MKRTLTVLLLLAMLLSTGLSAVFAEDAEIVDGKFTTTRKITVEIYDRANEGGTSLRIISTPILSRKACCATTTWK